MNKPRPYLRFKLIPPEVYGFRPLSEHKAIDFSAHWWKWKRGVNLIDVSLRVDWKCDHGGIHFTFVLLNFIVEWEYYDGRHWNYEAHRYMTDKEIAAEIAEYKQGKNDGA
jgi:hypothetical protein